MYKSKSIPIDLNCRNKKDDSNEKLLSKSPSFDNLEKFKKITIVFEGDGPLGILFRNVDETMVVSKVKAGTVADEYYELKVDMVVDMINGYESKHYTYDKMIKLLKRYWLKESKITIRFKYSILYHHIYNFLEGNGCEKYYENFIQLGVKNMDDLGYIEYDDLLNMNLEFEDRKKISKRLGLKCNLVIPKNNSMVFEYESPRLIKERENIDILRNQMFRKKEKDYIYGE